MNRGFSRTILKPNDKVRIGTRAIHRVQRKQEWANRKSYPCYFFFSTVKVLFIRNSCLKDKQLINSTVVRPLDVASQQCSLSHCHLHHRISYLKGHSIGSAAPTCLIWVLVASSFSRNSNSTSKVVILELWTTSKRSWQNSWGHLQMKTSSTATWSGSYVSGCVWLPKGTALKEIMLICSPVVNKKHL